MTPLAVVLLSALVAAALVGLGYYTGYRQGVEDTEDKFTRITEPNTAKPGTPRNMDAEPARVTRGPFRRREFTGHNDQS